MPGVFLPQAPEGLAPIAREPAIWIDGRGNACVDPSLFNGLDPASQNRLLDRMAELQREHAEAVARAKADRPNFVPPRTVVPRAPLEQLAIELTNAGAALLRGANVLRGAKLDLEDAPAPNLGLSGADAPGGEPGKFEAA